MTESIYNRLQDVRKLKTCLVCCAEQTEHLNKCIQINVQMSEATKGASLCLLAFFIACHFYGSLRCNHEH